jgi:hypothetical protein
LLLLFAAPLFADSKAENLRPLDDTPVAGSDVAPVSANAEALEQEYRKALEERLAEERKSYEGSLTSLWLSNAAVWTCLLAFIVLQALSAKKKAAELARLKSERES